MGAGKAESSQDKIFEQIRPCLADYAEFFLSGKYKHETL